MKKKIMPVVVLCVILSWIFSTAGVAAAPPAVGGVLPDFTLSAPKDFGEKGYLGLSWWGGSFKIPRIKAKVLIIEIFSMYCPYCQAEAPKVNALYEKIEADPFLKGKMRVIGIGVGNSAYEVNIFKKRYNIPFPLFPDGDFAIHKQLGEVRTPYFIGITINPDGTHRVFFSKLGAFEGVDTFLDQMVKLSGLR